MSKATNFNESTRGTLVEEDGTYEVTLLTPGAGASAYYTEEFISEYAPIAFPKGTHVYFDHLNEGETRSIHNLAGVLSEDTTIREDGAAINRLKPRQKFAEDIADIREHIGLSISASGKAKPAVIDGQQVTLAESFNASPTNTVDIVPWPGREGSGFNESLQSGNKTSQSEASASGNHEEGNKMELSAEAVGALADAISTKIGVVLTEALAPKAVEVDENADRLATIEAIQAVETAEVPASVKARLTEGIKDGSLDVEAVKGEIASTIALREELKTDLQASFTESRIIGARGNVSGNETPTVKGWGA